MGAGVRGEAPVTDLGKVLDVASGADLAGGTHHAAGGVHTVDHGYGRSSLWTDERATEAVVVIVVVNDGGSGSVVGIVGV